jgi:hypothetical protein
MATVREVYRHGPMFGDFATPATAAITVPYMVEFTNQSGTPGEAVLASGLPHWGDVLGAMTLQRKTPRQVDKDFSRYVVECGYALPVPGTEAAPESPNGDVWNVQIDITTKKFDQELQADVDGNPLVNSAGDPIKGITVQRADEEIRISYTTDTPDWSALDDAFGPLGRGCVNSEAFTLTINGVPRPFLVNTVHFEEYSAGVTVDVSGVAYTRMGLVLGWREDGWKRMVADQGLRLLIWAIPPGGGTATLMPVPITHRVPKDNWDGGTLTIDNSYMEPITEPVYLNGSGGTALPGDPVVYLPDGNGFVVYEEANLSTLLLDGIGT